MSLLDHLPVLPVILPLLAAPVCVLVEDGERTWWVAVGTAWLTLLAAAALLWQVALSGTTSYALLIVTALGGPGAELCAAERGERDCP